MPSVDRWSRRRRIPDENDGPRRRTLIAAGAVSLAAYLAWLGFCRGSPVPHWRAMVAASERMAEVGAILADHRRTAEGGVDVTRDPNRTGLIGPELGELTTSVGHLEAKRTTTNPDMAGLIVHLLVADLPVQV